MKFSSLYLPPEGKYKPTSVKGASTFGYPWQYNPLVHKFTSDPCFCQSRNVFRRYADNKVVYTRTGSQIAKSLYTYYLYDQQNCIIEIGEVALPVHITDDNWYQYKYKSNAEQNAFIRNLGGRINVMVAIYHPARAAADGISLDYYPLASISCYGFIDADTTFSPYGEYLIESSYTHYSFSCHSKGDIDVSITLCEAQQLEATSPDNSIQQTAAAIPPQLPGIKSSPDSHHKITRQKHRHPLILDRKSGYNSALYTGNAIEKHSCSSLPYPVHLADAFSVARQPSCYIHAPPSVGMHTYPRPPSYGIPSVFIVAYSP